MHNTGKLTHVVIGLGEVGGALRSILDCSGYDSEKGIITEGDYDVMHVCFPYSKEFPMHVGNYQKRFNAKYIVIHSTVPVGTSHALGALFSPVRGAHPNLKQGLLTFEKYVAGDPKKAWPVAAELKLFGIPAVPINDSHSAEAAKLWDTTQYGVLVMLEKEIHQYCEKHGLNFELVYSRFNRTYNDGYRGLGRPEVVRPYLKHKPGKVGGHCVIPNARLLESESAARLIHDNEKL